MRGKLITAILIALAVSFTAAVEAQPAHASTASVQHLIRYEAARAHLNAANTNALVAIAGRESTWRPWVSNGWCLGLFQLSWPICQAEMRVSPGWRWFNAENNVWRAISYIKARYGSPLRAWESELERGWY